MININTDRRRMMASVEAGDWGQLAGILTAAVRRGDDKLMSLAARAIIEPLVQGLTGKSPSHLMVHCETHRMMNSGELSDAMGVAVWRYRLSLRCEQTFAFPPRGYSIAKHITRHAEESIKDAND